MFGVESGGFTILGELLQGSSAVFNSAVAAST